MDKGKQPETLASAFRELPQTSTPSVTANPSGSIVKFGRMDAEDESILPMLDAVPSDGLLSYQALQGSDDYYPCHTGSTTDLQTTAATTATTACLLTELPAELLDNILSYLSPVDLSATSQTCRILHTRATSDFHWQALVQAHVPGGKVTTPYPCESFRDLWVAHDPRWFLPKYKIWFSGHDLTGKLILVRYDQRRGCIEGYQLLAVSSETSYKHWEANNDVIIHSFEPTINLHLDRPVIHLRCSADLPYAGRSATVSSDVADGAQRPGWERHAHGLQVLRPKAQGVNAQKPVRGSRFAEHVSMTPPGSTDGMFRNLFLSKPMAEEAATETHRLPFPYANVWPPPRVPARHRFAAADSSCHMGRRRGQYSFEETLPTCRSEISDQGFRIRTWLEMRPALAGMLRRRRELADGDDEAATPPPDDAGDMGALLRMRFGTHLGEETTCYSTLDPALYTPTADCPWRGIWVGDYSGHGCEFLLMHQIHDDADGERPEDDIVREPGETDEDFEARRRDARVYRGRLEAIKLTGDPNVPRGEYTFVAEDMGPKGLVEVLQEDPFKGVRMVKSQGHVAGSGFLDDKFIESRLLLISHNRLAQYWLGFGHISFFERVDIDRFLKIA
ncbi:F-box domain-containing protein [Gaeumannomyces tritici R3-111a-1]|uniref:F-box domain-containing protein n=1 Tax=Gaeumannomyces tritici (strain R3-111a-1) TaxID=644352 RepID=J3PBR3_GAET3|nr:F-box domain-containing protein [Gaeumannomyces tritici R3-111a-1]EJT71680.1 F-box domain-containing protein [Gaeumannomyces tritici R3-111a-1]